MFFCWSAPPSYDENKIHERRRYHDLFIQRKGENWNVVRVKNDEKAGPCAPDGLGVLGTRFDKSVTVVTASFDFFQLGKF